MARIYTRAGDGGDTGLLFGGRVRKNDPRCEAYGSTDQAVSAMGLARALSQDPRVQEIVLQVQRQMFILGAELATAAENRGLLVDRFQVITPEMVDGVEALIDELKAQMSLPPSFIVPGASAASGALDLARGMLRTAERRVVDLQDQELLENPEILRFVNRLSDLMFVLGRYEDRDLPFEIVTGEQAAAPD